jgi:NIPSNAP
MQRRSFLGALTGCGVISNMLPAATPKGWILELRHYAMRNSPDGQMQRTSEFIEKYALPAGKRAGEGTSGVFANMIGSDGPYLLLVSSYPSLAAMEEIQAKSSEDKEFTQALAAYYARAGLGYHRVKVSLLRGIESMPKIEPPPIEAGKAPRVFELRTYESNNSATLARKVQMFEKGGELGIFRRLGIRPVFFGTAIAGDNLPQLTYMVCYDDLGSRDKAWQAFGADPEWQKLRSQPGLADAEIVSNITNTILRPLPFSPVR